MEAILETFNLTKRFKGLTAVDRLDLRVNRSEIHGLIGPNGSGKSTTINLLTGFLSPSEGEIRLEGKNVQFLSAHRRARLGLVRTFQEPSVFASLTVEENLRIAASHAEGKGTAFEVGETLALIGLLPKKNMAAGNLSYGEQKLLDVARVSLLQPSVLLLDEPGAGLSGPEKEKLLVLIKKLKKRGCAILFSEHDVGFVMGVCDRITVLNFGSKICEGTPEEVRRNPQVIEAYLGGSYEHAVG